MLAAARNLRLEQERQEHLNHQREEQENMYDIAFTMTSLTPLL